MAGGVQPRPAPPEEAVRPGVDVGGHDHEAAARLERRAAAGERAQRIEKVFEHVVHDDRLVAPAEIEVGLELARDETDRRPLEPGCRGAGCGRRRSGSCSRRRRARAGTARCRSRRRRCWPRDRPAASARSATPGGATGSPSASRARRRHRRPPSPRRAADSHRGRMTAAPPAPAAAPAPPGRSRGRRRSRSRSAARARSRGRARAADRSPSPAERTGAGRHVGFGPVRPDRASGSRPRRWSRTGVRTRRPCDPSSSAPAAAPDRAGWKGSPPAAASSG